MAREGIMDFGTKMAVEGQISPLPERALFSSWFERSSAEHGPAAERGLAESNSLLDRLREAGGLVYTGDGEDEL